MQGAQADSFVANVAFTGTHQSVIFSVSQAYFDARLRAGVLVQFVEVFLDPLRRSDQARLLCVPRAIHDRPLRRPPCLV